MASAAMVLTGAVSGGVAEAAAPVAVKDAVLAVPIVRSFAVDSAHGHLLFASGQYAKGVLVTNLAGRKIKTVAAVGGIDEVTVPRGSKFAYAASAARGRIFQIDLATLSVVRTVRLPLADCPESLAAVSATLVAFAYGCNQQWAGIGVLDLGTGKVQVEPFQKLYWPLVRAIPGGKQFIVVERGPAPRAVVYDASTGAPVVVRGTRYALGGCPMDRDITVSPDASKLLVACDVGGRLREYSLVTLRQVGTYANQQEVTAAAYSPDGAHVASGSEGIYDVSLFRRSTHSLAYAYSYSDNFLPKQFTPPGGVAFSSDGAKLYTLQEDDRRSPSKTHLMTFPALSVPYIRPPDRSTLSLTAPTKVKVNVDFKASGVLSFGPGVNPRYQTVYVRIVQGGRTLYGFTFADDTGAYSIDIKASDRGTAEIYVRYAGDARHVGSQNHRSIAIV